MVASCAGTRSEPAVTKAKPPFGSRRVRADGCLSTANARAAARRGSSDRRALASAAAPAACGHVQSPQGVPFASTETSVRGAPDREPEGSEAAATAATCAAGPADGAGRLTEREQQASDFAAETRGLDPAARARRQHPAALRRFRRQNRVVVSTATAHEQAAASSQQAARWTAHRQTANLRNRSGCGPGPDRCGRRGGATACARADGLWGGAVACCCWHEGKTPPVRDTGRACRMPPCATAVHPAKASGEGQVRVRAVRAVSMIMGSRRAAARDLWGPPGALGVGHRPVACVPEF